MENDWKQFAARVDAILPTLATKADLAVLRADMEAMRADVARWTLATVIGLLIGFGGLAAALSNSLRSEVAALERTVRAQLATQPVPSTAQATQPIVIYLPAPSATPAPPAQQAPAKK